MIRARLRSNGWVLAELFLVFIVMWFLCDSLGCLKYTFYRPLGYNIDHVYQLSMITGGESRDSSMTNADKYLSILQKLEREPAVEVAALSYWSLPMSGNNSYNSLAVQDHRVRTAYNKRYRGIYAGIPHEGRCQTFVCGNACG